MDLATLIARLRQYPIAVGAGVVALILGVLLFLRWPVLTERNDEYSSLEEELDVIYANRKEATGLEQAVAKVETAVEAIEESLVRREDTGLNHLFFYRYAEDLDVRITSVSTMGADTDRKGSSPVAMKHFEPVDFQIRAVGSYASLLRLLHTIRTDERQTMGILSYNILESDNAVEPDLLVCDLVVRALGEQPEDD